MGQCAIAAGRDTTLNAAEEILRAGGNAFDAAVASTFTMFASEPCMASAGAGGFAMCHSRESGTHLLDFFTQTPISKEVQGTMDFHPIEVDFGTEKEIFHVGKASIAVPGVIAGIFEIHERYGTLPLSELVQHAKSAAQGVIVDDFGEIDLGLLQEIFRLEPEVKDIFFKDDRIKKKGDVIVYPHLSDFMDFLVAEGVRGFYAGDVGELVSKQISDGGGFLTRRDFEEYRVRWSHPMSLPYRGGNLLLPNGPSLGGAILALLDRQSVVEDAPLAQVLLHVKEELHETGGVAADMAKRLPELSFNTQGTGSATKGTSHFSIMDDSGNSIGLTISIGEGSGYFIPGTDMQMNNMLGETYLLPGGAHSWEADRRLNSMMTPIMLQDHEHNIRYVGGSGGAGRIPYVLFQVLEAIYGHDLPLMEATLFPRMHWHDGVLHYEEGADIRGALLDRVHKEWNEHSLFFGGVHSVMRGRDGHLEAAGDPRRFGVATTIQR